MILQEGRCVASLRRTAETVVGAQKKATEAVVSSVVVSLVRALV